MSESGREDRGGGGRERAGGPGAGRRHDRENTQGGPGAGGSGTAPELPEGADPTALDADTRAALRSLPKGMADKVASHLVAAGMWIVDNPASALEHARYARARASRVAAVREVTGLCAYRVGEWAEAISELRAVRRMSGSNAHVSVLADCERALGRPERAIELAREVRAEALSGEAAAELRIVAAGARRDMGDVDAAVVSLQDAELDPRVRHPWSARLFYAYADNLLAAGRPDEALRWFLHAADADEDDETDAAERAVELGEAGTRPE